jgi:hypothetical protein
VIPRVKDFEVVRSSSLLHLLSRGLETEARFTL